MTKIFVTSMDNPVRAASSARMLKRNWGAAKPSSPMRTIKAPKTNMVRDAKSLFQAEAIDLP